MTVISASGLLTTFAHDSSLDLDAWVGQRSCTYRFALTNGVTGEHLGNITPIRGATLSHDTSRTIKRQLQLSLGKADTAAINPINERIKVYMVFPNGLEYPLGKYMFTDMTKHVFTAGKLGQVVLNDEMYLVDQQILSAINGVGFGVVTVINLALSGLPISYKLEESPYTSAEGWGLGTSRGQILGSLALSGDYWSPWFDNHGVMQFQRTFNPADEVCDFDFDSGHKVLRASIGESNNLLTAPNTFVVISNNPANSATPVVGIATVPPSAPHSVVNRGFAIPSVQNLQLTDSSQAFAVANGLANRLTIFDVTTLSTAPDPRHDSFNVIRWQGANWLELAWSMPLTPGTPMTHTLRKGYTG